MKKITTEEGGSLSLIDENLVALKAIFPTAFSENGIDFDALRILLGGEIVDSTEKYGLHWHGKKNALQAALSPSFGALRPCREESVDWDSTQNMFIEGDNLEALKLLQRSYSQKIKMIYIDPPYNTGKEFIYPDKWQDSLDTYLRYTGQIDESGDKFSTNTETDGRYHTNWLNMMYPRLKKAWYLLSDDGVIFISIDDNEMHHLRMLMNEIFSEYNFCGVIKRRASRKATFLSKEMSDVCDYVVIYSKGDLSAPLSVSQIEHDTRPVFNDGNKISERVIPAGTEAKCEDFTWLAGTRIEEKAVPFEILDDVTIKNGKTLNSFRVRGRWRVNQEVLDKTIYITKNTGLRRHVTQEEKNKSKTISDLLDSSDCYNEKGSESIEELLGKKSFDNPKPIGLVKYLIRACDVNSEEVVLDFFAGSSTTAHAIMQLNFEDGGNRRCISVQLPERIQGNTEAAKLGYKNIAEIGKERIRRAAGHIKKQNPNYKGDLGFKVFKLDTSNLQSWDPNKDDLKNSLLGYEENIKQDRSEEDVLYELLQKCGEDFATQIKIRKVADKTIHAIGDGAFFACMDKTITEKDVEAISKAIIKWRQELNEGQLECYVYFRDNAFSNDSAKINMDEILQQSGISHVRSL